MKVTNLLTQKAAKVAAKPGQEAQGVKIRLISDSNMVSPAERLFELDPGGLLASSAANNQSRRQFFVLQGIGELVDDKGESSDVLGSGTMIEIEASEAYTIRNIGTDPLILLYLVEQQATAPTVQSATVEPTKPKAKHSIATLQPDIPKVLMYFDGGEPSGNAGKEAVSYGSYAFFVPNNAGEYNEREADEVKRLDFAAGMTSNEAEYLIFIRGLQDITARITALGQSPANWHIDVKGDSNLVVNQVNGTWKVKAEHLKPYIYQARELLKEFGSHTLTWHSRTNSVRILGH